MLDVNKLAQFLFSSSARDDDSMDSNDSFSPFIPTGNCSWLVHTTASNICTKLMNVSFCWTQALDPSTGSSCQSYLSNCLLLYTHTHTHTHTHLFHISNFFYTHTHTYTHTHLFHILNCLLLHTHTHIHTHTHTLIPYFKRLLNTHTHTHIYTHTHSYSIF